jgi:hypothetical protein
MKSTCFVFKLKRKKQVITTAVVEADSIDNTRPIWLADNAAQLSLWLVLHRKRIKTEEIDFVSVYKHRHIPSECTEYCCPGKYYYYIHLYIYTKMTGKPISNLKIGSQIQPENRKSRIKIPPVQIYDYSLWNQHDFVLCSHTLISGAWV